MRDGIDKIKLPAVVHHYPLIASERRAFRIREAPPVHVWAERDFRLTKAYVNPGKFLAHPWQMEPLDAIRHYNRVYFVAPVQTGKSLMAEICCFYAIDTWSMSGMLMYANEKTAAKVFKYRLRPAIEQVPVLRRHWSGNDDDLTVKNLELTSCVWGIASAQNKDDIASFPAVFGYASECAKYKAKEFDPLAMLRGRQQAALASGNHKLLFESSPWEVGDIFYREIYQRGTLILTPHFKCPHCGAWITFLDSQVKEVGTHDHDPARIRAEKDKAVRYECQACGQQITETDRCKMLADPVWCADEITEGGFHQDAERITSDGDIIGDRSRVDAICYNWNRFVDVGYKFYEALARFFAARTSPEKLRIYETEDMARFWRGRTGDRPDGSDLLAKCAGYYQYGEQATVPDDVIIATCGIDTQDGGFFYVIRGYGANMKTWLLRHDFIECNVKKEIYKSKAMILARFREEIEQKPLKYADGRTLQIFFGFQDRGGHRPDDVDHLVKNVPWLNAYIGLTRIDPKKPLVEKSTNGKWWLGQTQLLSDLVAQYMELDTWYLPDDVGEDYRRQVVAQYYVETEDAFGVKKNKWIRAADDHYRDCENYNFACVKKLKLDTMLTQSDGPQVVEQIVAKTARQIAIKPKEENKPAPTRAPAQPRRGLPQRRWSR